MRVRRPPVVGAAVTALVVSACSGPADSPFAGADAAYGWAIGAAQGDVFTDGVKVAGMDRVLGAYQVLPGFPPVEPDLGPLRDAAGYVVPSDDAHATKGVELLLGVRKTVPGRATRRAVLVTYEVDGDRDVVRLVSTLAVCEPARRETCPQEHDEG